VSLPGPWTEVPNPDTLTKYTPPPRWRVFVRAPDLSLVMEVGFVKLAVKLRLNDVSTWTIELASDDSATALLRNPDYGVRIDRDAVTVLSGPAVQPQTIFNTDAAITTVTGVDDTVVLRDALARPQPATAAPPYATAAYDVRTGVASSVLFGYVDANIGPSAPANFRASRLTLGTDPVEGASVSGNARWENLLTLLQPLALTGGVGFRVMAVGLAKQFQVWSPTERSLGITFSPELGNLGSYTFTQTRPTTNYIVCAGGGEGTDRVIREGQDAGSVATWGRVELFRDRRDTTDTALMDQTIAEELTKGAAVSSVSATLLDLPGRKWGTDYFLGDTVTVLIADVPIVETVQQVSIDVDQDGEVITPRVGSPDADLAPAGWYDRMLTRQAALAARVTYLERR
jgi:hypothetical protein